MNLWSPYTCSLYLASKFDEDPISVQGTRFKKQNLEIEKKDEENPISLSRSHVLTA